MGARAVAWPREHAARHRRAAPDRSRWSANAVTSATRTPPFSGAVHLGREEESELLGTLIVGGARFVSSAVEQGVTTDSFYYPHHGAVFAALTRLTSREEAIDGRSVVAELAETGTLDAAGGQGEVLTHGGYAAPVSTMAG